MTRYPLELQCRVTDYNRCHCANISIYCKHPSLEIATHAWKALRTHGNFPRRTLKREMHVVFKIPLVYISTQDYVCSRQTSAQTHENANISNTGQSCTQQTKHTRWSRRRSFTRLSAVVAVLDVKAYAV